MSKCFNLYKYIIFCFIFLIVVSNSYAADEHVPSGFPILLGVTDDVDKDTRMLRTDPNGYLKTTMATALDAATDDITVYLHRGANSTNTQVTCDTTTNGEQLIAANTNRIELIYKNMGSQDVYICYGDTTCTVGEGSILSAGEGFVEDRYSGLLYCTVSAGSAVISVQEVTP